MRIYCLKPHTAPENLRQLAETIQYVYKQHRIEVKEKGKKAREKCKKEYGWQMMEERLVAIFEKYKTD